MSRAKIITKEALNYAEALYQISSDIKNVRSSPHCLLWWTQTSIVNPTISLKENMQVIDRILTAALESL